MHGSVHVHMVYRVRAKLAVRITARFAIWWPSAMEKTRSAGGKPDNLRSTGAVPVSDRSCPAVCSHVTRYDRAG